MYIIWRERERERESLVKVRLNRLPTTYCAKPRDCQPSAATTRDDCCTNRRKRPNDGANTSTSIDHGFVVENHLCRTNSDLCLVWTWTLKRPNFKNAWKGRETRGCQHLGRGTEMGWLIATGTTVLRCAIHRRKQSTSSQRWMLPWCSPLVRAKKVCLYLSTDLRSAKPSAISVFLSPCLCPWPADANATCTACTACTACQQASSPSAGGELTREKSCEALLSMSNTSVQSSGPNPSQHILPALKPISHSLRLPCLSERLPNSIYMSIWSICAP